MLKQWQQILEDIDWQIASKLLAGMLLMVGTFLLGLCFVDVGELGDFSWQDGVVAGALSGLALGLIFEGKLFSASRWGLIGGGLWSILAVGHLGVVGWMVPSALNLWSRLLLGGIYGFVVGGCLGFMRGVVLGTSGRQLKSVMIRNCKIWMGAIAFGWVIGGWLRGESQLFIGEVVGLAICWGLVGLGYSLEKTWEEDFLG